MLRHMKFLFGSKCIRALVVVGAVTATPAATASAASTALIG